MMGPVLDKLAEKLGELKVAKVDVDSNYALASRFRVEAIPLLILMKDGREIDRFVGLQPPDALAAAVRRHID